METMQSREEYLAHQREYYHANKERLNARKRAERATDEGKAKRRESARRYYLKHREEILAGKRAQVDSGQRRAYYAANRDRIMKWRREYIAINKEKLAQQRRAYRQANLEKVRAQEAAKRARRRLQKGG